MTASDLLQEVRRTWRPPPKRTVTEWADENRRLSAEASAEPGKYRSARTPYVREIMDSINDPKVKEVWWMKSAQVGAALAVDTPIPTPDGYKNMGDLNVGDVVFDENGQTCSVTYATEIMEDHDCYAVKFCDGSEIIADAEHRWYVQESKWGKAQSASIKTTEQMLPDYKHGDRYTYSIPVAMSLDLPSKDLKVSPYILGYWLGDGNRHSNRVTTSDDDANELNHYFNQCGVWTKIEKKYSKGKAIEIVINPRRGDMCNRGHDLSAKPRNKFGGCPECARQKSKAYQYPHLNHKVDEPLPGVNFHKDLRDIGAAPNKRIPQEYLRASHDQRLELLQGLMDSDGHVSKRGVCEFYSIDKGLTMDAYKLIASLGLKPILKEKHSARRTSFLNGRYMYPTVHSYLVRFRAYSSMPVAKLKRKHGRQRDIHKSRPGEVFSRRITSIERIKSVPVRCIQVDSPSHLYLCGDNCIPTHNTEILNNICGYFVDQHPSSVIIMQPSLDMGMAWSKDRLAPMVRDTPCLRDKIRTGQTKDGSNTMLHKRFTGGHLTVVGANSAASMASRPIKVVLCDEVDRYPASAGDEGDPVTLVKVRSTTFWDRKFFACSTPTIKDVSRIEKGFLSGDQRYFHVPCQHCGHKQKLEWENLDFSNEGTLDEPVYRCKECGGLHREHHKTKMLAEGEWVPSAKFHGVASFHISALYSPWKSWGSVAVDFIRAKKGGPEQIKTFKNTMLGDCYEESGEVIDSDNLQDRATVNIMLGDRVAVPDEVLVATWGADVQHDRLEVELVGWGAGEESWSIAYEIINGSPDNPITWQKMDQFLTTDWVTVSGRRVDIPIGGIDTGDGNTQQKVYEWVKPRMGQRRGALPFKGASTFTAPVWSSPSNPKKGERDAIIKPYMIGSSQCKLVIYERLRLEEPGPGYMHFPTHYDPHYFKGLTAEKLITKYDKGFPRKEWHKIRERNEPLDCRVYAYAAMKILNPDFDAIQARVGQVSKNVQQKPSTVRRPIKRKMKMRGF